MKSFSNSNTKINVIVTSPPYNLNKKYSLYEDNKKRNDYLSWLYSVAKYSYSILENDGSFFLNISGRSSDPSIPFDVMKEFSKVGYKLQNTIHWIKSISFEKEDLAKNSRIDKDLAIGHFNPNGSKRYLSDVHEYIFHFTKNGEVELDRLSIGIPFQDKTNIGRWKSAKQDKRPRGNVWFIRYPTIREKRPILQFFLKNYPIFVLNYTEYMMICLFMIHSREVDLLP